MFLFKSGQNRTHRLRNNLQHSLPLPLRHRSVVNQLHPQHGGMLPHQHLLRQPGAHTQSNQVRHHGVLRLKHLPIPRVVAGQIINQLLQLLRQRGQLQPNQRHRAGALKLHKPRKYQPGRLNQLQLLQLLLPGQTLQLLLQLHLDGASNHLQQLQLLPAGETSQHKRLLFRLRLLKLLMPGHNLRPGDKPLLRLKLQHPPRCQQRKLQIEVVAAACSI